MIKINSLKKGKSPSTHSIVWTKRRTRCGAIFEKGKEFIVFVRKINSKFWTDMNSSWVRDKSTDRYTLECRVKNCLTKCH